MVRTFSFWLYTYTKQMFVLMKLRCFKVRYSIIYESFYYRNLVFVKFFYMHLLFWLSFFVPLCQKAFILMFKIANNIYYNSGDCPYKPLMNLPELPCYCKRFHCVWWFYSLLLPTLSCRFPPSFRSARRRFQNYQRQISCCPSIVGDGSVVLGIHSHPELESVSTSCLF